MPQHGAYKKAAERRSAAYRRRLDTFAEYLARGFSIRAAASALQVGYSTGTKMFREICDELGWQAR